MKRIEGRIWGCSLVVVCIIFSLVSFGCERYDDQSAQLVGKWQLYNQYTQVAQTINVLECDRRIEEFTANNENISYDSNLVETGRRKFKANDSMITIYGYGVDGKTVKFKYEYLVRDDTLRMRSDNGYGYIDEYYSKIGK